MLDFGCVSKGGECAFTSGYLERMILGARALRARACITPIMDFPWHVKCKIHRRHGLHYIRGSWIFAPSGLGISYWITTRTHTHTANTKNLRYCNANTQEADVHSCIS